MNFNTIFNQIWQFLKTAHVKSEQIYVVWVQLHIIKSNGKYWKISVPSFWGVREGLAGWDNVPSLAGFWFWKLPLIKIIIYINFNRRFSAVGLVWLCPGGHCAGWGDCLAKLEERHRRPTSMSTKLKSSKIDELNGSRATVSQNTRLCLLSEVLAGTILSPVSIKEPISD